MDTSEVEALKVNGEFVIRLRVDADQEVLTQDLVRGTVRVNTNELEDKILVKKDGMPEVAADLYKRIKKRMPCMYDAKGSVGRRYARQDEAGTPWCITIDGQTMKDQTVTLRDRDSLHQERVPIEECTELLTERLL